MRAANGAIDRNLLVEARGRVGVLGLQPVQGGADLRGPGVEIWRKRVGEVNRDHNETVRGQEDAVVGVLCAGAGKAMTQHQAGEWPIRRCCAACTRIEHRRAQALQREVELLSGVGSRQARIGGHALGMAVERWQCSQHKNDCRYDGEEPAAIVHRD